MFSDFGILMTGVIYFFVVTVLMAIILTWFK